MEISTTAGENYEYNLLNLLRFDISCTSMINFKNIQVNAQPMYMYIYHLISSDVAFFFHQSSVCRKDQF